MAAGPDVRPQAHGREDGAHLRGVAAGQAVFDEAGIVAAVGRVRERAHLVVLDGRVGVALDDGGGPPPGGHVGTLPPLYPEWLGDRSFCQAHGVRFPYVVGEMANGIATTGMVAAAARAGLLGFFGAAGLPVAAVDRALDELAATPGEHAPWGVNLIRSPHEPATENRVADLLLRRGVRRVSVSAFTEPSLAVVRCAATGLRRGPHGVHRRVRLFPKVSHPVVAERFMSPAPAALLRALVDDGHLTREEAELAGHVPLAEDITVEGDSGGHTDNRPLVALLPAITALRDEVVRRFGYREPVRVGAAGGLGSPAGVAAAFALGAAYVLTGSVNQAAVESGLSADAKEMVAAADISDVVMAPAADLFEFGGKVQVLSRGTMYAVRAAKLYELYVGHSSLEEIPDRVRLKLEREVLHASLEEVWAETARFWQAVDPGQLVHAEAEPKHRMALLFRWYLGRSSHWAIDGERARRADYQVWCGPAMGAFNRWAAGSHLAPVGNRSVGDIGLNLLEGAAVVTRAQQLRSHGLPVPARAFAFTPRRLAGERHGA
ncbi:PfaD family polyunsaturated fatty acid/polyketide biosynthesis protein [Saccharothrix australiensis]|uniref:PfaD family protein n=1 Tax=Saccharothrix australiensis TaxID=2072 RepID=A0A495VYJ8_9PSEU|nr:PfaD family polyunsaturated fatty acid/polyketide biosynthesis protein [Saccharothrix australiensis]RKT54501.1 PfaD family protein [Saccharothrix australiensis]